MNTLQFLESYSSTAIKDRPAIFGCPLDHTSTFRSGSDLAPNAIREASDSIETYSPSLDRDLSELKFADLGDAVFFNKNLEEALNEIELFTGQILTSGSRPLALGGEHTVTLPIIRALTNFCHDFIVIHLDAHTDLRMDYDGAIMSHATVIRRIAELIGPDRLIQLGVRSGTRHEFQWMKDNKTLYQWEEGSEKNILKRVRDKKVYVTLDLDVMDPACLPGTGNPESGGWFYDDLERFFRMLTSMNVVGADVVELNPRLDQTGMSSVLAAKIVRELLLIM